jgi:hypothetical protein
MMWLWFNLLLVVLFRGLTLFFLNFIIVMLWIVFSLVHIILDIVWIGSLLSVNLLEFSLGILSLSIY